MAAKPRIVLFHATPVAMEPITAAMRRLWPEAEPVNLLDDGLTIDRAAEGDDISDDLIGRFVDFGRYACRIGADGILVTCSAFGPAIDRMAEALPVPVVKPNEAMFRDAIAAGRRVGMVATFAPAVATMSDEFAELAPSSSRSAALETVVAAAAMDHLRQGDAETHNRLVAEAAAGLAASSDAIMLAHFSTSRAAEAVRAAVHVPVFTAPEAAVTRMRHLLSE